MKHLKLIPLIVVVLGCMTVEPAQAATPPAPPAHDEAHPRIMQDTAAAIATATPRSAALPPFAPSAPQAAVGSGGGPLKEIFGFGLASSLSDASVGYPTWDFTLLGTVAFFGLHVNDDGTFANDNGWQVWNSSQLNGLVSTAHAHGTKVVVTIIKQDFAANTPDMCAALKTFDVTVNNTVNEVRAKGVDGVNVDYEGLNGSCGSADPSYARHALTNFVGTLRNAMPGGSYLSIDSYASSAADPLGFFDIPGLNPRVDSFFVMAYDLEYSNYGRAPTSCASFCLGPTAPLTGYYYNDTTTAQQYMSAAGPSKVILGVPYYGRKACVASATPNQSPTSSVVADTYLDAMGEASSNLVQPGSYAGHRDANDPAGQERWDTWVNTQMNCTRELYWDDTASLGAKYDLVNSDNLRGVGIWNLNYGGGAPELWSLLNTHFACQVAMSVPQSPGTTEFTIGLNTGTCSVAYIEMQQFDSTNNQGWFGMPNVTPSGGAATQVAEGYPGHTYQFQARAHSTAATVSAWSSGGTTVSGSAAYSHPFQGLYTMDVYGGVTADASPPLGTSAYWPGWRIARSVRSWTGPGGPQQGFVLDGYGGLHKYGAAGLDETSGMASHYWGIDIARDFAFMPNGNSGFVLDGYGGLHPFWVNGHTGNVQAVGNSYWKGWDVARKVVIFADGSGGYVLDAYGGLHAFGINAPPPASFAGVQTTSYWPNWDIARDVVLIPGNGNHSGYVLDGFGGLHPFHATGDGSALPASIKPSAYWAGWDIARGLYFLPGSATAGYTLDGYGGPHPFGGAPDITAHPYWGSDLARGLAG